MEIHLPALLRSTEDTSLFRMITPALAFVALAQSPIEVSRTEFCHQNSLITCCKYFIMLLCKPFFCVSHKQHILIHGENFSVNIYVHNILCFRYSVEHFPNAFVDCHWNGSREISSIPIINHLFWQLTIASFIGSERNQKHRMCVLKVLWLK